MITLACSAPVMAQNALETCLSYIPKSSIFIIVSQDCANALKNYENHGVTRAFPTLKNLLNAYEKKSGITLAEEFSQTECDLIALTEMNPALFSFEILTVFAVKDINSYNALIDRWVASFGAVKKEVVKISGHPVFSLTSSEIKTPLFYLTDGNVIISSNKLEGLSKALEMPSKNSSNFLNSGSYEQIKRKFAIDSNLYMWISGKVLAGYLKLLGTTHISSNFQDNESLLKIFNQFTDGLEFVGFKKSVTEDGIESEIFISLNEIISKAIKTKLMLAPMANIAKLSYDGIEFKSMRMIPEKCDAFAAAHLAIPTFEQLMKDPNAKIFNFNIKDFNDKLVKKFKVSLDELLCSWAADEFFAAKLSGGGYMAGAKINNMKHFENALQKIESGLYRQNYRRSVKKYDGITYNVAEKRVKKNEEKVKKAYLTLGDYAIITNNPEAVPNIIETFKDKLPSIRASKNFVNVCDYQSGKKYKMISYVKTDAMLNFLTPYLSSMFNVTGIDASQLNLKNCGIANYVTSGGQHVKIKLSY